MGGPIPEIRNQYIMNTNELTRQVTTLLQPKAALIAYSSEVYDDFYLELRTVGPDGRMSEGRPVTVEFMNSLVEGYSARYSTTPHGTVPNNLLWMDTRKGFERYIWHNPPQKRMMFFHHTLGIESAEYNLPGIIYQVRGDHLDVFAYKGDSPTPDTELYKAPFFNVSGSSVCLGRADLPRPSDLTFATFLEWWEKKFWLTEFLHLGGGGNPTKGNLVLVTKAAKDSPFDLDQLVGFANYRLKDLLK